MHLCFFRKTVKSKAFKRLWLRRRNRAWNLFSCLFCFLSVFIKPDGVIAQLVERIVRNDEVVGSIPTSSTKKVTFVYRILLWEFLLFRYCSRKLRD